MEADEERNKSEKAQAYVIPLSTLLTYLNMRIQLNKKLYKGVTFQNR
jgi:hypothetical protein